MILQSLKDSPFRLHLADILSVSWVGVESELSLSKNSIVRKCVQFVIKL